MFLSGPILLKKAFLQVSNNRFFSSYKHHLSEAEWGQTIKPNLYLKPNENIELDLVRLLLLVFTIKAADTQ